MKEINGNLEIERRREDEGDGGGREESRGRARVGVIEGGVGGNDGSGRRVGGIEEVTA